MNRLRALTQLCSGLLTLGLAGCTYVFDGKLAPSDPSNDAAFGSAVAIAGDTAVVGIPNGNYVVQDAGDAYVYTSSGPGTWSEAWKLHFGGESAGDEFGAAVAIDGDTAVVGAPGHDFGGQTDSGAAYVFREVNGLWVLDGSLHASDYAAGDDFGRSVAISDGTIVVGAPQKSAGPVEHHEETFEGAAYVFTDDGTSWLQVTKLEASPQEQGAAFGYSVAINGDTIAVGAHQQSHGGLFWAGSVYTFLRVNGFWLQESWLPPPAPAQYGVFGIDVDVEGDVLAVGSSSISLTGEIYVFRRTPPVPESPQAPLAASTLGWDCEAVLSPAAAQAGDAFGESLALSGNVIIAGAGLDSASGPESGAVYVFQLLEQWTETQRLTANDAAPPDAQSGARFGAAVDIDGHFIVGAPDATTNAISGAGAAYVFTPQSYTVSAVETSAKQLAATLPDGGYQIILQEENGRTIGKGSFAIEAGRWERGQFDRLPEPKLVSRVVIVDRGTGEKVISLAADESAVWRSFLGE